MNDLVLDFTQQFKSALDAAEEYGNDMESIYDEPNEYTTSKFESLSMYLADQMNEWKDRNVTSGDVASRDGSNVQLIRIPAIFAHDIKEHEQKGCKCASQQLKMFLAIFPNAKIEYT